MSRGHSDCRCVSKHKSAPGSFTTLLRAAIRPGIDAGLSERPSAFPGPFTVLLRAAPRPGIDAGLSDRPQRISRAVHGPSSRRRLGPALMPGYRTDQAHFQGRSRSFFAQRLGPALMPGFRSDGAHFQGRSRSLLVRLQPLSDPQTCRTKMRSHQRRTLPIRKHRIVFLAVVCHERIVAYSVSNFKRFKILVAGLRHGFASRWFSCRRRRSTCRHAIPTRRADDP